MNTELLYHLWPLFAGACAIIVWLVRLEAKVLNNSNEHKNLRIDVVEIKTQIIQENKEIDVKFNSMAEKLNEIGFSLARIEGFLSKKHE